MSDILITKIKIPEGYKMVLEGDNVVIYKHRISPPRTSIKELINGLDNATTNLIKDHFNLK